jgi:asparagine synthase (glutamine-hydrolysing)
VCGIAGIKLLNTEATISHADRLAEVLYLQHHRGPDHRSVLHKNKAVFGHNRLAIIDLNERSHQPFSDPSGRYMLAFNGEIYNFRELKNALFSDGYRFSTDSDTEVLLFLLMKKGRAALEDLRGCFAFAFYDSQTDYLLLARDRMGINPLLFSVQKEGIYFSSELPLLLKLGVPFNVSQPALSAYFTYSYVPGRMTMVEDVQRLFPGHSLEVKGGQIDLRPYWSPKDNEPAPENYDLAVGRVRETVREAVRSQLEADVPLGTFLSGGVDSSIVSAVAREHFEELQTFSIAFEGNDLLDEGPYAQRVASALGTRHHEIRLNENVVLSEFEDVLSSFDEPFADSSAIAMYFLSKETSKHLKVALSGDGADELFGGYNKHTAFLKAQRIPSWQRRAIGPVMRFSGGHREGKISNQLRRIGKMGELLKYDWPDQYQYLAAMVGLDVPDAFLQHPHPFSVELPKTSATLNDFLLLDQLLVLPGDMLKKTDLMSMRHSLEVRTPFMDEDVVRLANRLPADWKNDRRTSKRILKDAFRDDLPEEVFRRPKHGFEVPIYQWMTASETVLAHPHWQDTQYLEAQGLFHPEVVQEHFRQLKHKQSTKTATIAWAYTVFQHWYDRMTVLCQKS